MEEKDQEFADRQEDYSTAKKSFISEDSYKTQVTFTPNMIKQ